MSDLNNIGGHRPTSRSTVDRGFTLVEMLIVVVVLGILATVAVLALRSSLDAAETKTCATERKNLITMVEAHFVRTGEETIVATGAGDDRYEVTLVNAQIMRSISSNYDIAEDGELTVDPNGVCA